MRRVGSDVRKKRCIPILFLFDPAKSCGEENIGAKPFCLHERSVVAYDRVKILVARGIGATAFVRLADAARAVDECLVEAAFVRLIRFLVAEVPFAKDAAGIAGLLKYLRQRGGLERHALAHALQHLRQQLEQRGLALHADAQLHRAALRRLDVQRR